MQQLRGQGQAFQDGQFQCIRYLGLPESEGQRHVDDGWRTIERETAESLAVPDVHPRTRTRTSSATKKHKSWSVEESSLLRALVGVYTENGQWEAIAHEMPGRTPYACAFRWSKIKAEENRQKRARRPKAAHANTITLSDFIELDQDSPEQEEGARVIHGQSSKSGRWLVAEDDALNAGVSAYLATLGLELQPPAYLSVEDSLNEDEQSCQGDLTASVLRDTPTPSDDQSQDNSSTSDIFTDLFESLVDTTYGASDGDSANDGMVVSVISAIPLSQLDSFSPTPKKSSSRQSTLLTVSQQCNDATPWTTGLDIVDGPAPWKSTLYLNTRSYPQLISLTDTTFNGQDLGLFPEEQACPVVDALSLGMPDPLNSDASSWMLSGNIEAISAVSQYQEHSGQEDTSVDLWTVDPQPTTQASITTVSQEPSVPLGSSLTFLTFSPPEASSMSRTRSTPLDAASTTTTHSLPHSYADHFSSPYMDATQHQHQYQYHSCDQLYDTDNLTTSSTATSASIPLGSLPKSIGVSCPLAVQQAFDSREAHSFAISRAMAVCPWSLITARSIPWRTGVQAQARWSEALDPRVKRGPWTQDEDEMLMTGVRENSKCWILIADGIPGRTQRQCRTRWVQITAKAERAAATV